MFESPSTFQTRFPSLPFAPNTPNYPASLHAQSRSRDLGHIPSSREPSCSSLPREPPPHFEALWKHHLFCGDLPDSPGSQSVSLPSSHGLRFIQQHLLCCLIMVLFLTPSSPMSYWRTRGHQSVGEH